MSTKIKLMRLGKMRAPYYRVVVADSRTKRGGRVIETIGKYHPKDDPSFIEVDSERAQYWLKVGAQPTEPVRAILRVTGDWQRFRGEPAPEPMKTAAARPDKKELFQAAAKQAAADADADKPAPKKRAAKAAPAAEAATTPDPDAQPTPTEDTAPAETPVAETPTASAVVETAAAGADDTQPAGESTDTSTDTSTNTES